jgi:hypothetical protein
VRERVTIVSLTGIQVHTHDRPGAFTTHPSRPDCTDSIIYAHIDVRVHPNSDTPRSPFVFIFLKTTDIKGSYKDDSVYKYSIFYLEPDETRSMCVATGILTILFMDDVFEHIRTPEQLFHPEHPPLHAYSVKIKAKWLGVSVFRQAQFDPATQIWGTHPTKATPYNRYYNALQHFSLIRGFHRKFSFCVGRFY